MRFLEAPDLRPLDEVAQDSELTRRAGEFARASPGRVLSLAAIKVVEKLSVKGRFSWFALYCAVAGVAGLIYFGRA